MKRFERLFSREKAMNATAVVDSSASSRNFVEELCAAEKNLQSTKVAKHAADYMVSDSQAGISTIQKMLQIHPMLRPKQDDDQLKAELRVVEDKFRSAKTAQAKAGEDLEGAEIALARIQREIAGIPAYAKAVEEQRKLWRLAHEMSHRAWHQTPVLKLDDDFLAFDCLIEQEEKTVWEANAELRAARLPELVARLRDKSGQLLPHHAIGSHVQYLANGAAAERARLV